jgi:hypothetical protein
MVTFRIKNSGYLPCEGAEASGNAPDKLLPIDPIGGFQIPTLIPYLKNSKVMSRTCFKVFFLFTVCK